MAKTRFFSSCETLYSKPVPETFTVSLHELCERLFVLYLRSERYHIKYEYRSFKESIIIFVLNDLAFKLLS